MIGINLTEEPRAIREAKEEGREEAAIEMITRSLTRHLQQELPGETRSRLTALPYAVLTELSKAFLDFNSLDDLENWINLHSASVQ